MSSSISSSLVVRKIKEVDPSTLIPLRPNSELIQEMSCDIFQRIIGYLDSDNRLLFIQNLATTSKGMNNRIILLVNENQKLRFDAFFESLLPMTENPIARDSFKAIQTKEPFNFKNLNEIKEKTLGIKTSLFSILQTDVNLTVPMVAACNDLDKRMLAAPLLFENILFETLSACPSRISEDKNRPPRLTLSVLSEMIEKRAFMAIFPIAKSVPDRFLEGQILCSAIQKLFSAQRIDIAKICVKKVVKIANALDVDKKSTLLNSLFTSILPWYRPNDTTHILELANSIEDTQIRNDGLEFFRINGVPYSTTPPGSNRDLSTLARAFANRIYRAFTPRA